MVESSPTPVEKMQRVLKALALFGDHEPTVIDALPASNEEITHAEHLLGRQLPETMRLLYQAHNGSQRIVSCWPLISESDQSLSILTGSDHYREWQWEVPPELLLFGDDGSESAFGLWITDDIDTEPIVVELGECFDPACYAIVGDDLASFLLGRAAIYFVIEGSEWYDTDPMIEALGIPGNLRHPNREPAGTMQDIHGDTHDVVHIDDDAYLNLVRWANPMLPDPDPDPYRRSWTVEKINEFVANRGR